MPCLDENAIVALASGRFEDERRAAALAHVDDCSDCALLLAEAAAELDRDTGVSSPTPIARGRCFGRYLVVGPLGSGGLGQVVVAYDPDLDRRVALKLIKPGLAGSEELRARLWREAQALAKVSHPNVVPVFDVGADDDGTIFVAMELVDGITLRRWTSERRRSWAEIRDVFVAAGAGLVAVHGAGLIHRDFKPGNVMVGHDGRVRVLDFGLARAVAEMVADVVPPTARLDEEITLAGTVLGTPAYMAPEQSTSASIDARADQFAFCVALFEAIHGARPFAAADSRGRAMAIERGAIGEPSPRPDVPTRAHRALLRGLAFSPADRFATMAALLDELRGEERARRRRAVFATATLVSALAGGAAVWILRADAHEPEVVATLEAAAREAASRSRFLYPPPDDPSAATAYTRLLELEAVEDERARGRADELRREFSGTLAALGDRYWSRPGGEPFAVDYYAEALVFDPSNAHARERVLLTPGELATLRDRAGRGGFGEHELAAATVLEILAEPDEHMRDERLERWLTDDRRAAVTVAVDAERLLARRERPRRSSVESSSPTEAPNAAQPSAPVEVGAATVDPVAPAQVGATRKDADELVRAGQAAVRRGESAEAERAFHRALAVDRHSLGALVGLGELYFERREYGKALEFARRAVTAGPKSGRAQLLLGDAAWKVLRYADARTAYEAAQRAGHPDAARRLERLEAKVGER